MDFMDELVRDGSARNRREIFVKALRTFVRVQGHKWTGSLIFMNGVRTGLISKGSLGKLVSEMSEDGRRKAGRSMGNTLKALAMGRGRDLTQPENYKVALQMIEEFGWGNLAIDNKRITITSCLFPEEVIRGYLETALSRTLDIVESSEDINVFQITNSSPDTLTNGLYAKNNTT